MDYFLSGGVAETIDPTIMTTQEAVTVPAITVSSMLGDTASQFIPSEFLSFVDWPFVGIIFVRVLVIIWVLKDSTYRSSSTGFCLFSLLLVTIGTPIVGLPIYLAIRPLGYKHERQYWKTAIDSIENIELLEHPMEEETEEQEDEDIQHIAELKKEATLAQRRAKKVATKKTITKKETTTTSKPTTRKPAIRKTTTTSKPTTIQKIPTPKKAATRTA